MSWFFNLLTGTPFDLIILMGLPCLLVSIIVGMYLLICAGYDNYMWRKFRNEHISLSRLNTRNFNSFIYHRKTNSQPAKE